MKRIDARAHDALRQLQITSDINPYAEGSVEICCGNTKIHITASIEQEIPKWKKEGQGGWITAEYGMLPRATHTRNRREASAGKQGGRTMEIQRLIGRSLRAAVDMGEIEGLTIKLDCDVLVADGGTRTASITGAWVALARALDAAVTRGILDKRPQIRQVVAVSVGVVSGCPLLDLCYEEDSQADFDMNLVYDDGGRFIEFQGTSEGECLEHDKLLELLELGKKGADELITLQRGALL